MREYNTGHTNTAEMENFFIQSNISYYKNSFSFMDEYGNKTGWNWSAFLFPVFWCWYRRMNVVAIVSTVVSLLAVTVGGYKIIIPCQMLFFGLYGTAIYRGYVAEELAKIKKEDEFYWESICVERGGVSIPGVILAAIIINLVLVLVFPSKYSSIAGMIFHG